MPSKSTTHAQVVAVLSSPWLCPAAGEGQSISSYKARASNATFALHGYLANASTAEAACRQGGGHLASFSSLAEQAEVEQYYLNMVGPQG